MRYQVVTYSYDIGSDEKKDYPKLTKAIKEAEKYKGKEEYAAVYDRETNLAFLVFGDIETHVFNDSVNVITIE